jgi:hypothetical protein
MRLTLMELLAILTAFSGLLLAFSVEPCLLSIQESYFRVKVLWAPIVRWTPPPRSPGLGKCGGLICGGLRQFLADHKGDGAAAWSEFYEIFRSQVCVNLGLRAAATVRYILDLGYTFFMYGGVVRRDRPEYNVQDERLWRKERFKASRGRPYRSERIPEVWFHHHGLRWVSERVKEYVRGRDILDVGASEGDSLSVLSNYTDQRVVSYELIPETSKAARRVAETFPAGKHFVFNVGISNKLRSASHLRSFRSGESQGSKT